MNEKEALLKVADAVSGTRDDLEGLASCCLGLEVTTGEKVWGTFYRVLVSRIDDLTEAYDDLADLTAATRKLPVDKRTGGESL